MEDLSRMWELQQVETELVRLRNEWHEIKERLNREARLGLDLIRDGIQGARNQWNQVKGAYEAVVEETASVSRKLHESNQRLYTEGSLSKELMTLQQSISQLEKRKKDLEDKQLVYIEKLDELEKKIASETCRLQRLEEQSRSRVARLKHRQQQIREEYQAFKASRELLRKKIPIHLLVIYSDLVKQKKRPLAVLKGDNCGACGMVQSVLNVNALKKSGQYTRCSSCGRILVPESII